MIYFSVRQVEYYRTLDRLAHDQSQSQDSLWRSIEESLKVSHELEYKCMYVLIVIIVADLAGDIALA